MQILKKSAVGHLVVIVLLLLIAHLFKATDKLPEMTVVTVVPQNEKTIPEPPQVKTVKMSDSAALGAFRITRPVAYFIAPLITGIGLIYTTDGNLFAILGVVCLVALYPILKIKDTNQMHHHG